MTPADPATPNRDSIPVPEGWEAPTPVDARLESGPGVEAEGDEELALARAYHTRRRRFWTTTVVFGVLWLGSIAFVDTGQGPLSPLLFLLPIYLLTLPFVLRIPKRLKKSKTKMVDRLHWHTRLMIAVVIFIGAYIPFMIFSGAIIPFASLVEYGLFTLLLFFLLRLSGRSAGVAPSVHALPPATHRLHKQLVAPIDDAHYQRTLWLNYSFVEKAKAGRQLERRLDELMESNGVPEDRRLDVLGELNQYHQEGGRRFRRAGGAPDRDRRTRVLEQVYAKLNHELENAA